MGLAVRTSRMSSGRIFKVAVVLALIAFLPEIAMAKGSKSHPRSPTKSIKGSKRVARAKKGSPSNAKRAAVPLRGVKKTATRKTAAKKHVASSSKRATRSARRATKAPGRRVASSKGKAGHSNRVSRSHRKSPPVAVAASGSGEDDPLEGVDADSPVLSVAEDLLGIPYRLGGSTASGIDCSGLTQTAFSSVGIDLPHSARAQFAMGERVSRDDLQPGDLVFFRTHRRYPSHVGIYAGNGKFIHAARHSWVRVDDLDEPYYNRRYLGARRMVEHQGFATHAKSTWKPGVSCAGAVSCLPTVFGPLPPSGLRYIGI